ncbi:MAG TPA: PQQ-dependent sugar dehydrogenase [Blastocatellia bacterium]|nr:PQQ-dependent sugar dehydrogenase [Blastocatellia bacterium]
MTKLKYACTASLVLVLLFLGSIAIPPRIGAQTNPVTIAPGFEFNLFADPTRVPEFAASAYNGPVSLAFDSRGRLFVGTYNGRILIMLDNDEDGRLDQIKTFATGLIQPLGLEFRANGDLFLTNNELFGAGRIIRLRDLNGDDVADESTIIIDGLPSEGDHQTDRLKFGPDGLLYFGQGSSTDAGTPDPGRPGERPLNASILRIDVDNPTISVVATGLRNPFGMAFHPENGQLFTTDGGSGELGQAQDTSPLEEINWIVMGSHYGFPGCEGPPNAGNPACAGVRGPIATFAPHLTPTSIAFYTGPQAGDSANQMLVTLFKHLPGQGGDLQRFILTGSAATGFQTTRVEPSIIEFGLIDPNDGPVDTAIDPISGDIYVARFDPVTHRDLNEHHHFIYRIHRAGSDALSFIGAPRPSAVKAGSTGVSIVLGTRRVKPGAVVFNVTDNVPLVTRQGSFSFELIADLPAGALANERTITLEVRNPDNTSSNQRTFAVTRNDPNPPPPPPDKTPQIASMFVYKKKRSKVRDQLFVGENLKKFRLVVSGTDFDGAELLVNNTPLAIESSSATELVGRLVNSFVQTPGELTVQVRNSNGKTSNTLRLTVSP